MTNADEKGVEIRGISKQEWLDLEEKSCQRWLGISREEFIKRRNEDNLSEFPHRLVVRCLMVVISE